MKNPFSFIAAKFYRKWKPAICKNHNVMKELQQLYPSQSSERVYDNYQIRKFSVVAAILIVGVVSAVCLHLSSQLKSRLEEGVQLTRNEWGAGDYEITLQAKTGEWSREISFLVKEREFNEEEREVLLKKLQIELPQIMKKDNWDLEHIVSDLYLPSFVPGYPFQIRWESTDSDRISSKGEVKRSNIVKGGEQVTITATVIYEEEKACLTYEVVLLPEIFDEEEEFFMLLENKLKKADQEGRSNKEITLPESLYGKEIKWKEVKPDRSVLLIWITILGSIAACSGMDKDLKKGCERRKKQLLTDYFGFVSKLRLYLSAGLTVRNAFIKIANDYGGNKRYEKKHYLYEEMKIACYQLENGVMEEKVYQEFGRRCEEMQYRRLTFLLSVHLKQGNSQLLQLLEKEADSALEDRRYLAKKAGEEAGTKLLFPMMLMMIVVMFLILLPAYFNFESI